MKKSIHQPSKHFNKIGWSFAVINLLFLFRMIYLIASNPGNQRTYFILLATAVLAAGFSLLGFLPFFNRWYAWIYSIPGSIVVIFGGFVIIKKGLKLVLRPETDRITTEVGTWFIAIFLWAALSYLATFLKTLFSQYLPEQDPELRQDTPAKFVLIGFVSILIVLSGFWLYTQLISPLPFYANYDPEISYMLNSGTPLIDLELYKRMDHPGTLLQLIGTAIIILMSPVSLLDGSYPYAIMVEHPNMFLFLSRFFLLVITAAGLYLLYRFFRYPKNWTGAIAGLCTMLVYFAVHSQSLQFLTIWSPNSFNFVVGTSLLLLTYLSLLKAEPGQGSLSLLSLAVGLGATFHVYLITLIFALAAAVVFKHLLDRKKIITAIVDGLRSLFRSAIGYLIGTLTIIPYYRSYVDWIADIITHQGIYGTGESGFTSLSRLVDHLILMFEGNPLLFFLLGTTLLTSFILLLIRKPCPNNTSTTWAMLAALFLQASALILIISKHPTNRYLLSIASLLPIILLLIYQLFEKYQIQSKYYYSAILAVLLIAFVYNIAHNVQMHRDFRNHLAAYSKETGEFINEYAIKQDLERENIKVYWTYGTYSPCYSLWFGNEFSKLRYKKIIRNRCPAELYYNTWDDTIADTQMTGLNSLFNGQTEIVLITDRVGVKQFKDQENIRILPGNVDDLVFIVYQQSP